MANLTKNLHMWISKNLNESLESEAENRGLTRNAYIQLVLSEHMRIEEKINFIYNKMKEEENDKLEENQQ